MNQDSVENLTMDNQGWIIWIYQPLIIVPRLLWELVKVTIGNGSVFIKLIEDNWKEWV
jgi:hypothetical protein